MAQNPLTEVKPQVLERFIDNQGKELALRAKELELKQQQDKNDFEFAKQSLSAQKEDRQEQRNFVLRHNQHRYYFIGAISFLVIAFVGALAFLDKEALAAELVKSLLLFGTGGFGGYHYGRNKASNEKDEQS